MDSPRKQPASPPTHIQDVSRNRINIRCYVRHLVYWCNVSCFTPGSSLDCSQFLPICKSVWHLDGASSRCYRNSNLNIPQLLVLQYFYKSFRDPWPVKAMVNSPLSTSCWYRWHEFGRSGCSRTHSFSWRLLYPQIRDLVYPIYRFAASLHITCFCDMVYTPLIIDFANYPALDIVPVYVFHLICVCHPLNLSCFRAGFVCYSGRWNVQIAKDVFIHRSRWQQSYVPLWESSSSILMTPM